MLVYQRITWVAIQVAMHLGPSALRQDQELLSSMPTARRSFVLHMTRPWFCNDETKIRPLLREKRFQLCQPCVNSVSILCQPSQCMLMSQSFRWPVASVQVACTYTHRHTHTQTMWDTETHWNFQVLWKIRKAIDFAWIYILSCDSGFATKNPDAAQNKLAQPDNEFSLKHQVRQIDP